MNVYVATLGCRLNEAEAAAWERQLRGSGHGVVSRPEQADVMVLNTCAVTAEAARKSRKLVSRLHRQNPTSKLVITGCYAELEPEKARELTGVDLVLGNRDKEQLVATVLSELEAPAMPAMATEPGRSHMFREQRTRAFVKVQDGCRNRCTFCIVTIARGQEQSRRVADIITEVNELAAAGVREIVLTGVHLGGYGSDLDTNLSELVRAVLRETDVPRVRLSSLEPWDLPPSFGELWEHPRLMPHLHLPLQSGCDTVLKRMARRCPTERYRALVEELRSRVPDLRLTTDLIVGFPGETEEEHRTSLEFVESIGFSHVHVFAYSARAGTTAARMPGHLPDEIKRRRSREAHQVAARMKLAQLNAEVGRTRSVLWEGRGDLSPDGGSRQFWGYTDNYLRVETCVAAEENLENRIDLATLVAVNDPPQHLIARIQ